MEAYDQESEEQRAAADSSCIADFATLDATTKCASEEGIADVEAFRSEPAFKTTPEGLFNCVSRAFLTKTKIF